MRKGGARFDIQAPVSPLFEEEEKQLAKEHDEDERKERAEVEKELLQIEADLGKKKRK